MNDRIFIEDIEIFAKHGAHAGEKLILQRFLLSIGVEFDATLAKESDVLADTIDYGELLKAVQEAAQNASFNLLEKLAQHVAHVLFKKFQPIMSISLLIKKFPEALADKNFSAIGFSSTFLRNE